MQQALISVTSHDQSSAREIAAGAAHALNNLLGVLYAESSYLEAPADPKGVERARVALDQACASATALSAALSLLGLSARDVEAAGRGTGFMLDVESQREILGMLSEAAGVPVPADPRLFAVVARLDRDTLRSLLICGAFVLRRNGGPVAELRCAVRGPARDPDGVERLSFDIGAPAPATPTGGRLYRHPCAIALDHAAALLPGLGVGIDQSTPSFVRVALQVGAQR